MSFGPTFDYHDAPISGFLECLHCHQWFAYYCEAVVDQTLWHWSLQPVQAASDGDPKEILRQTAGEWFSVLEDRRRGATHCSGARLSRPKARPPIPVVR